MLIILNFSTTTTFLRDFVYLYITKQTCMQHVFYHPIYGTVPRAYNGTLSVFPSNKPRVVSGNQPKCRSKIVESSK